MNTFVLNQASAQESFDRLNLELFGMRLYPVPFRFSNSVRMIGIYDFKSQRMGQGWFPHSQRIILSRRTILTQYELDRTMAHEMIHHWEVDILHQKKEHHGPTFLRKMAEINKLVGDRGFVDVTCSQTVGAIGGTKGQKYHVALFRCGMGGFGGFSLRPLTKTMLTILDRVNKPYRVIVTTSHEAQHLTQLSRARLSSRRTHWRGVTMEVYHAILMGAAPRSGASLS